jgi:phosphoglycolate phosphatase/AHBA synthesis associated protein
MPLMQTSPALPRAILFDLDGVLVRSDEAWFLTVEEAGRRFRGRPISREEFFPSFGQGTAADIISFGLRCDRAELDRFYAETMPRFASQIWTNPQAVPLLEQLAGLGIRRAVVTNTVSPLAAVILEGAGLRKSFETVACADQVVHAKPAPDLVRLALDRLGLSSAAAWMIGDSRFDREAAQAAEVRFVGLGTEGAPRIEQLRELGLLVERTARGA